MAEQDTVSKPPRRGGWLRWGLGIVAGLVLLGVVAYFVVTSSAFFKGVILPRAGAALGAEVTVTDASISPFSQVVLRGLKVQAKGAEPLFTAGEIRARYSLMAILRGNLNVDEVAVSDPVVNVVMNADGTSNLDAFTKRKTPAPAPAPSKAGPPPRLDLKRFAINNATVHFTQLQKDGNQTSAEITGLNLTAENLKNGQPARLAVGANLKFAQGAATNAATIVALLKGNFGLDLGADLLPTRIQGGTDLAVTSATGAFADAAQMNARLTADLSLTEIKQLALNFTKGAAALGVITVSGPLDVLKQEGKLTVDVTGIGNEVLSLAGGRFGIYFGSTKLAAHYEIELKNQARFVNTTGTITADQFSLTRSNLTTPTINFQLGYSATVDLPRTNATLRTFTFDATQAGRPLLKAGLTKAMVLDWSKGSQAAADSAFDLNLTELNLADWKPFLGEYINAGVVNGQLTINVQQAGRLIGFDLNSKLAGLSGQFGSNRLEKADLALNLRGQLTDFDKLDLGSLTLDASRLGQPVATAKGAGSFSASTRDADFQTELNASLAPLSELLARPDLSLTAGTVTFTGHVAQKNLTPAQTNNPSLDQNVTGKLQVADVTGRFASNRLDRLEISADLDLGARHNLAEIHKCVGSLRQSGQPGGNFEVTGNYQLTNQIGEATFKLTDLNQNVLRSFTAGLAPMSLDSISINATATAHYNAKGDSGVKGGVQVVNLLISDPKGQLPKVPMTADVKLEAGLNSKGEAEIKQFTGNLLQGDKAAGSFDATGRYDLTNRTGQVALKVTDLNQNALQPFLASALGNKTLASISINASLNAGYDPKGASEVKGGVQMANLVVKDPTGAIPATPLEAKLQLDAGLRQQTADIRECVLTLTPTDRAKNELQLKGQVDFAQTNAITGNLKLAADSLDATRYYNLFGAEAKSAGPSPAPPAAPAPGNGQEPAAIKLPVKNFTVDASVGRFYLREVAITNFLATVKLDGGAVLVKPFQLTLNGAPINAAIDLNLGVPGFKYDVDFKATDVPLAPLVNSFQPERKGQIGGTASAMAQVKGAGVTGASLQKNLTGQFEFASTNLNLAVANVRSPIMKTLINLVVGIPDLIRNPGAALGNLLGRLAGGGASGGGFVDELTQSPIDQIIARGQAGNGQIDLQRALVQSPAFQAEASGTVTLAPVLTNSALQIPIMVSLRQSLAGKVGLIPAGTPTNAVYVKLPDFVKMKGTVGEPKTDINYLALAAVAAKAGSGILGNTGAAATGQAAGLLGTVENLFGGRGARTPATNASPATGTNPPPATTPPPVFNPFDLFKRK